MQEINQRQVFRTIDAKGRQHELRLDRNHKSVSPQRFLNTKTEDIFIDKDFYKTHKKGIVENVKLPDTNHVCYKYPKVVGTIYKHDFEKKAVQIPK